MRRGLDFATPLPGVPSFDRELTERLGAAWENRRADYRPRTRHLNADGTPKYTNRLLLEASPYLRQHAHNPVNWFPWSDEAFELARRLGRPVLLSVGYSTCHWCHVMEEESFDDNEIAQFLNENYIAIKVDREVRPDIDAIYMSAVQLLTGRGGWPMTVWLTPDRRPFSGGSYFPARDGDRGASVGFLSLLRRLKTAYDENPERIVEVSGKIANEIRAFLSPEAGPEGLPGPEAIARAADYYHQRFDEVWGGLRGAPKFPSNVSVRLLLRHHRRTGDAQSLSIVTRTLEQMAAGGIQDQIGGGFHRYSTDERWLIPHFEKMLYDNALIALAYLEAYQVTGRNDFAEVVRSTLRYVAREMTGMDGAGFFSATDADSLAPGGEREEGWYFTWTPEEIAAVVGRERARVVSAYYGVTPGGNLEGRTVLHVARPPGDVAKDLGQSPEQAQAVLDEARDRLYAARRGRPAPLRDEKILTAWNGLMISAFAQAGLVLGDAGYIDSGRRAAEFLLAHSLDGGRLGRTPVAGGRQPAYLEDYAFLIGGLLDLYEATSEIRWLEQAIALDRVLAQHYEDSAAGGFFRTADDHEALIAREKPGFDEAEPSGNAVQLHSLLRLHEFTTHDGYRERAERTMRFFNGMVRQAPMAAAEMLVAVDFRYDTPKEIIIVVPGQRRDAEPFLDRVRSTFLPNRILAIVSEETATQHAKLIPLIEGKYARDGRPTAYVCENRICDLPTTDPEVFAKQIRTVRPMAN